MNPDIVEVVARATKDYGLHCQRLRDGREVWRVMDGHCVTIGGDHKTLGLALEAYRLAVVAETLTAARPAIMDEAAGIAMDEIYEDVPNSETWAHNEACRIIATAIRAAVKP